MGSRVPVRDSASQLFCELVVAAATENYNNCKNYNPGTVIVEKMAQAVVIHKNMFLQSNFAIIISLIYILCNKTKKVIAIQAAKRDKVEKIKIRTESMKVLCPFVI